MLNAGGQSAEAVAEGFSTFSQSGLAPQGAITGHQTIQESMRLMLLVRAYQTQGHFAASLDPLKLDQREVPIVLDPALYGFTDGDLDRECVFLLSLIEYSRELLCLTLPLVWEMAFQGLGIFAHRIFCEAEQYLI